MSVFEEAVIGDRNERNSLNKEEKAFIEKWLLYTNKSLQQAEHEEELGRQLPEETHF